MADDAYACLANRHLVFADLRSDQYRCLNRNNTATLVHAFPGFQGAGALQGITTTATDAAELERIMNGLSKAGLVSNLATGRPFAPIRIPAPSISLAGDMSYPIPRFRLHHFISFVYTSIKASGKLRLQSIQRTVRQVEVRRHRLRAKECCSRDSMHELCLIFHCMRPYYARSYLCRFDSLALIEFLAPHHCFPLWVFGVRCEPFGAHCWVQDDEYVLNDSVEVVQQYTPIMAF